jgi:hypothetical protein
MVLTRPLLECFDLLWPRLADFDDCTRTAGLLHPDDDDDGGGDDDDLHFNEMNDDISTFSIHA